MGEKTQRPSAVTRAEMVEYYIVLGQIACNKGLIVLES